MNTEADWRGPMRAFRVFHYDEDGKFTHGEQVKAHQVSLPARGVAYYDFGGEWLFETASNTVDNSEVVRLYAEVDGEWRVVFEAPEGRVSVREVERAP